ncbi:MAG: 8-oxo-dGTP diphosphatase [Patescibacteria group bacterium]|nr:8-oxo-dGTP diphosphatase [Patescibacteria group bacterium]
MTKQRHMIVPAAYLILRKGKEVLLSRRFQTGFMDGSYSLPAGHVDAGESIRTCAVREALEEIGVTVRPEDLRLVHTRSRLAADYERVDLFFEAVTWSGEIQNKEPEKCDDLAFFSLDALPEAMVSDVREVLLAVRDGVTYSEGGWNA